MSLPNQKPTFIFFKMYGCGHCTNFFKAQSGGLSEWDKLTKDPSLKDKVNFVLYQFGNTVDASGKAIRYELDAPFNKIVTHAPWFLLHQTNVPEVNLSFAQTDGPRTYENMKTWILKNLSKFTPTQTPQEHPQNKPNNVAEIEGLYSQMRQMSINEPPQQPLSRFVPRKKK